MNLTLLYLPVSPRYLRHFLILAAMPSTQFYPIRLLPTYLNLSLGRKAGPFLTYKLGGEGQMPPQSPLCPPRNHMDAQNGFGCSECRKWYFRASIHSPIHAWYVGHTRGLRPLLPPSNILSLRKVPFQKMAPPPGKSLKNALAESIKIILASQHFI